MAIALALVLVLIVIGSVLFDLLSPWWLPPIASNWGYIDGTITLTFWITGASYIAIIFVYGLLRVPLPASGGKAGGVPAGEQ